MTKQVEFFETDRMTDLQYMVNTFLRTIDTYNFLDVKYNHYNGRAASLEQVIYTAMVVYNDVSVPEAAAIVGGPAPIAKSMPKPLDDNYEEDVRNL